MHDPGNKGDAIKDLRISLVELDEKIVNIYGWADEVTLDHDFYQTEWGLRFTLSQETSNKILARLRALSELRRSSTLDTAPDNMSNRASTQSSNGQQEFVLFDEDGPE